VVIINRTILFFWATWLSVVTTTNVLDGSRALGWLPESVRFASGNWSWINQVMDPLGVARSAQAALFLGAIIWEAIGAALFWRAVAMYRGRPLAQESAALLACGVNLGLWAAFQVLDEVFLAYQPEAVHRDIFVSQLATLLILHFSTAGGSQSDVRSADRT
jgi:hypothetical protein